MANPYSDPFKANAVPKRKTAYPTTAVRVAAHAETASNDLSPVTAASTPKPFGKLGIRGDGQQK